MKKNIYLILLLTIAIPTLLNAQIAITIEGLEVSHTVSPMIQGQHLVYVHDADSIYEDGSVAELYQDIGAGFLRWPGGTVVTHYHWDSLTGNGWADNWKPGTDTSKYKDPSTYMDIDEYTDLCYASNAIPMLGINMSSGMEWHREDDGLNEAVSMIKYCQSKGFDLEYFYLDNETYHTGNLYNKDQNNDGGSWSAELYATWVNVYADSIRKYVPNAKLIPNWEHSISKSSLDTLINIAGANIDYMDLHWYWNYGEASWDEFIATTPMRTKYSDRSYINEIKDFAEKTTNLGHPHIKLASLEWNIGPGPWEEDSLHTSFKTALMQSEMQMQMIMGDMQIASLWSTQWPGNGGATGRHLLDATNNYEPSPTAIFFEMYQNTLGADLVESSSANPKIMVITAIEDTTTAFVYLLSKHDTIRTVEITLNGYEILSVKQAVSFTDPGVLVDLDLTEEDGKYTTSFGGYTLNMIEFEVTRDYTSTNDIISDGRGIEVWPNPASNEVNIKTDNFEGTTTLKLFSISGEEILSETFNASSVDTYTFSVANVTNGTYNVQVNDATSKQANSKLVIE
ncbi:MAG: T9SS type A sorting domain-containing protein [Flavobacteriales bacterium]|nr:T9SS type A sorting domain-containing protein [Flavobacteriales bacterium]